MRPWLFLLAPLAIWATHFMGVYGIASVADVVARPDDPAALIATGAFTLLCAAGAALMFVAARRLRSADETDRFVRSLSSLGAVVALVAIVWQGLPALVGH